MAHIYLDYAAATPVAETVLAAMQPYFSEKFYNPSALYLAAQNVAKDVLTARQSVAQQLGVRPSEVIFTAGGTEANNLALAGVMQRYPDAELLISAIEHDSVREPAALYDVDTIAVQADGRLDLSDLQRKITDKTVLISVGLVNSEIGVIQDLHAISEIVQSVLRERKAANSPLPLLLHTDACQAGNYLSLQAHKLGVDMLTLNGGKVYGPKQSGALFVRAGIELNPLIYGGGQEFSKRSGTENVPAIIGFAKALEEAQSLRAKETERLAGLQQYFIDSLVARGDQVRVNGSLSNRVVNNVHVTFFGHDNERLMMELDERDIQCSVGSACSASKDTPSHVLQALGLSDEEAQSSLRFTMGRFTTKQDIDTVLQALKDLTQE